ncbi:hypothetical protein JCM25156A_31100 [Komagataeibacter kakiaceti JCM 25156]|uniref:glycosyltransferase family 9 protein n=1 Tax=Komagataeibacter kakiaceti TaxID=943261 RepID=UPI000AE02590|nr:glycosyltransferase family 9 protein [Komagataeibacter kakiaceti]
MVDNLNYKVEKIDCIPDAPLEKLTDRSTVIPAIKNLTKIKFIKYNSGLKYLFGAIPLHLRMKLQQIGWLKNNIGRPILCGVVSVRVLVYATKPLTSATLTLDDDPKILAQTKPVFMTTYKGVDIWSVNIWLDSQILPPGAHKLRIHAYSGTKCVARMRRFVEKMPQDILLHKAGEDVALSDAFVPSTSTLDNQNQDITDTVITRPVVVHHPRNSIFSRPIKSVLILRTDQLGDVSASLPAMVRIRKMFPDARITVISQEFVQPIIEHSGIADELLTISLSYSHVSESRFLTEDAENQVRKILNGRSFDLAIDLSPGDESQPLMLLCDAHYRVGFKPERFPFIDFGIEVISRDKINSKAIINHAAHIMMLVQALESAMTQIQPAVSRTVSSTDHEILQNYNLAHDKYAIIHSGSRHELNQWPMENFIDVARYITEKERMPVVFFTDKELSDHQRNLYAGIENIYFLNRMEASSFDTIISHAHIFIGNDTGPKHLASIRGVPLVVSISVPRLNWREWGHNRGGVNITRQVPCTGCGVNNLAQCGKEAVCIRSIPTNEVISEISKLMNES